MPFIAIYPNLTKPNVWYGKSKTTQLKGIQPLSTFGDFRRFVQTLFYLSPSKKIWCLHRDITIDWFCRGLSKKSINIQVVWTEF